MNREWHLAHVLGQHASLDQRVAWHEEHARECRCREMPDAIAAEIRARREAAVAAAATHGDPDGAVRE